MPPRENRQRFNSKFKPAGSGTTSHARKERRALQFANAAGQEHAEQESPAQEWQPSEPSTAPRPWVLAAAPWRRDADDSLPKEHQAEEPVEAPDAPPIPSRLVDAKLDSSHSSSDDWGVWKGKKHPKDASDESIQFEGDVVNAGEKIMPRLGIDWIGTVVVKDEIPPENIAALQKLFDNGIQVCVLMWCVEQVGQRLLKQAEQLPFFDCFATFAWTNVRTGDDGKVDHWTQWACDVIIEKGEDICKEALSQGLHVFPVQAGEQKHEWFTELGHTPMVNFAQAVDTFLEVYS